MDLVEVADDAGDQLHLRDRRGVAGDGQRVADRLRFRQHHRDGGQGLRLRRRRQSRGEGGPGDCYHNQSIQERRHAHHSGARTSGPRSLRPRQARSRRLRRSARRQQFPPIGAAAHLVAGGIVHEFISFPNLPAAAKRPVQRNEAGGQATLGHGEIVLRGVQILLRRQHGGEVARAQQVLVDGDTERLVRGGDALAQERDLLLPLQEAAEAVLDLLLRRQHGILVVDQQRLQARVLHADAVGDLPVVQDRPAKTTGRTRTGCRVR